MTELVMTAQVWGCRPSDMIEGLSGYAKYCLDSAGAYYYSQLRDGKMPQGMKNEEESDASTWL